MHPALQTTRSSDETEKYAYNKYTWVAHLRKEPHITHIYPI